MNDGYRRDFGDWKGFCGVAAAAVAAVCLATAPMPASAAEDPTRTSTHVEDISLFGSYLAGRQASGDRDRPNAARFYADALKLDPDNRMLLERAMVYHLTAGDIDGALELAPRTLEVVPTNLGATILLGIKAMHDGDFAAAREKFDTDEAGPIARLASNMLTMWSLQAEGMTEEAQALIESLEEASAFGAFKDYHEALLADMQGRAEDADKAYQAAYDTTPGLRTVEAFGRFLERQDRRDDAISLYRKFLEDAPDHPIISANLARAEAGGETDPMIADAFAGTAETLYSMGSALTRDGGGDLALIYLNLAVYAVPEFSIAHFLIADMQERQNRHEEAIAAYTAVSASSPLKRESEIQAALNLDSLDRTDEARARLDALIEKDPTDRQALISAGTMMRAGQRFDEALPYYDRAIQLIEQPGTNDWQLYYFRGICYERTDRWDLAEKDLQTALELEPEQPLVLNYLGYSWIDLGVHLEEGLDMVRRAVEQRPEDGYIVDSLGWAYYRLGDFERAVEELERAVELRADDPVINDHLGDAYWRVDRKTEARFQWDHALAMEPEEEEIPKIEAKLRNGMASIEQPAVQLATTDADGAAAATPRGTETVVSALPDQAEEEAEAGFHVVTQGDTLWDLARDYLGDPTLFGLIYEANRDLLDQPGRIFPGARLAIPPKP